MIRELTKYENYQIELAEIFHIQNIEKPYNYKRLGLSIFLIILFAMVIVIFDDYWFSLIAKIGIAVVPISMWINYTDYTSSRKNSQNIYKFINQVREQNGIKTDKYSISKALYFQIFEDEGDCFALEIKGEDKTVFLWDYVYFDPKSNFPSTEIEIYSDDFAKEIFGKSVISSGMFLEPIHISGDVKWKVLDLLPQNKEVIDFGIDSFLEKIKAELKK